MLRFQIQRKTTAAINIRQPQLRIPKRKKAAGDVRYLGESDTGTGPRHFLLRVPGMSSEAGCDTCDFDCRFLGA